MSPYTLLKFVHILSAIVAVGFNISYSIWIPRASRDPQHLKFTLDVVRFMDDRIANPLYALLLLTGLGMLFFGSIPITTLWIALALVFYVALLIVGLFMFTPRFRQEIAALDTGGPTSPDFLRLASQTRILGMVTGLLVVLILVMMVFKPQL